MVFRPSKMSYVTILSIILILLFCFSYLFHALVFLILSIMLGAVPVFLLNLLYGFFMEEHSMDKPFAVIGYFR